IDNQIPHFPVSPVLSLIPPVLLDSYSYVYVPLTLLSSNSSMVNKTVCGTALLSAALRFLLAAACARSLRLSPHRAGALCFSAGSRGYDACQVAGTKAG